MYVPDSYWTSVLFATLSTYFSLVSSFCSSDQMFAADFFQIPPRDGHPCLSGYTIPTIRARWGLAPVRHYSCRAYKKKSYIAVTLYHFKWCHQESNRGHKDFQSFALPTELWHHHVFLPYTTGAAAPSSVKASAKVVFFICSRNFF